tara:strand:- start:53 stop:370 length:318 start_codon:yes stop_codon:yes gene_type:complete
MSVNVFVLSLMMKRRTNSMPIRKSEISGTSVKKVEEPKAEKPRKFADVVKEIQKLREKGKTVPEIADELKVSYVLANQVVLRSYKMTVRTEEVFKRQEDIRLGLA